MEVHRVDVRAGLLARPRTLPPKYFYDAHGSRLFDEITRLPEYYPTRAERAVLEELGPRLAPDIGWVSLRPRLYDTVAVVHRKDAVLSPGARLVIELAVDRLRAVTEPLLSR